MLCQKQDDGSTRPVSFASKGLSKSEQHYPAHKLEFLALKWAVCDKFNDYLAGRRFTVLTDNNPLTYVLTSAKLDACGHRWVAALASYDFSITYRPGKSNADGDAMSRHPLLEKVNTEEVSSEVIKALCFNVSVPYAETLGVCAINHVSEPFTKATDTKNVKKEQRKDPLLSWLIQRLERDGKPLRSEVPNGRDFQRLWTEYDRFLIIDSVLYRP